jgi:hypothetical protein
MSVLFLGIGSFFLEARPITRVEGAVYLSDFTDKPLILPLKRAATAAFDPFSGRYAGTLRFPQSVEITAVLDDLFRVRGRAQQGQILGWIRADDLEGVPEDFVKNLKAAEERRLLVERLIAANEVALGMTPEEVGKSLGRPQKTTNRADADGSQSVWEFIRYQSIPQQTTVMGPGGVATIGTTFVKVPVGTLTVVFREGVVVELEQTEGNLLKGNQISIVAPPVLVSW